MASDLARISFDPTRAYRSVITQQGRVALEADSNEAALIAGEALRLETIDIVGPAGTPDNGYAVSANGNAGFSVAPGTMYLGGWRLQLDAAVPWNQQPDWQDWVYTPVLRERKGSSTALVALLATEQGIGAVEDRALREVALGGPDTAARSRLMQHVLLLAVDGRDCATAQQQLIGDILPGQGLQLDASTCEVTSMATLQVSFVAQQPTDPCCPPAAGGYLGADNQLVRVTVCSFDANTGRGVLAWGWNNASPLFRAQLTAPAAQTLIISPSPVDAAHTPQQGQLIEVLRTSCVLGPPVDANFVAAGQGVFVTLAQGATVFDPDSSQLTLPQALAQDYQGEQNTLFVRLWQAQVPFTSGVPVQIDTVSGIVVTVTMPTMPSGKFGALPSGQFVSATPFWHFAVRPNTPQQVYPQRYLQGPQPPSGPRQWLCDLAVIALEGPVVLEDCRRHFQPLVDLEPTECCGLVLGPDEVLAHGGLQAVVDLQAGRRSSLRLLPGSYKLPAPLLLTRSHDSLLLEACGHGVILLAAPVDAAAATAFGAGLVIITDARAVCLRGLAFLMQRAAGPAPPVPPIEIAVAPALVGNASPLALCGVRALDAVELHVEDCIFDVRLNPTDLAFGACIFLQGDASGLAVLGNRFSCSDGGVQRASVGRFVMGLWLTPAPSGKVTVQTAQLNVANAQFEAVDHRLDDAGIVGNRFEGMTLPVLVVAQLGDVRCNGNRIRACCGGLWFISSDMVANVEVSRAALRDEQAGAAATPFARLLREGSAAELIALASQYAELMNSWAGAAAPRKPVLSDEVQQRVRDSYAAQASEAYATLVAAATQGAAVSPRGATRAAKTAGTRKTAKVRISETAVGERLDADAVALAAAAHDTLERLGLAAAEVGTTLKPTLYLADNDIELTGFTIDSAGASGPSLAGINVQCVPFTGTNIRSQTGLGSVFFQGNRVQVPDQGSIALFSIWAAQSVVCGNQFYQLPGDVKTRAPALFMVADPTAQMALTCNIVDRGWLVVPARAVNGLSTGSWEFLNTVN